MLVGTLAASLLGDLLAGKATWTKTDKGSLRKN